MKILILFFSLLTIASAQTANEIYALHGLSDPETRQTHLFYSIIENLNGPYHDQNIYHLNTATGSDTVQFHGWSEWDFQWGSSGRHIEFLEFYNSDPNQYVYAGFDWWIDPVAFMHRFDWIDSRSMPLFILEYFSKSQQNDSLFYAGPGLFISNNGGFTWRLKNNDFNFISVNPFNDTQIFGTGFDHLLFSPDSGQSRVVADSLPEYDLKSVYFDCNETTIYSDWRKYNVFSRLVRRSDDNCSNWQTVYSDSARNFIFCPDPATSGGIFIARNREILHSIDFGQTFYFYKILNENIVGLFKPPRSEELFAATAHYIYQLTPNSVKIIKNIPTTVSEAVPALPGKFEIAQNHPNPFNTATTIEFSLSQSVFVQVLIYDTAGRLTAELFDGFKPAGQHRLRWNAGNFASGTYFAVLQGPAQRRTIKLLLLK